MPTRPEIYRSNTSPAEGRIGNSLSSVIEATPVFELYPFRLSKIRFVRLVKLTTSPYNVTFHLS